MVGLRQFGLRRLGERPPGGFNPLADISNQLSTIPGSAIFAPWQQDTLFQDAAGTTPVTDFGQPVGLMLDVARWGGKSLAQMLAQEATSDPLALPGYHATRVGTDAARPIYQQDSGGRPYLACDGSDDGMVTPSIDLSATDKIGVFAGVSKTVNQVGVIAEFGRAGTAGRWGLYDGVGSPAGLRTFTAVYDSGFAPSVPEILAPTTYVGSILTDRSAPTLSLRRNGQQVASSIESQGTGNYGNYPISLFRRDLNSLAGRVYGLILHPGTPDADFIAQAEALLAAKTGVTL